MLKCISVDRPVPNVHIVELIDAEAVGGHCQVERRLADWADEYQNTVLST